MTTAVQKSNVVILTIRVRNTRNVKSKWLKCQRQVIRIDREDRVYEIDNCHLIVSSRRPSIKVYGPQSETKFALIVGYVEIKFHSKLLNSRT
jgi:hypothetical protein